MSDDTATLCRVCGYVLEDCITHTSLRPRIDTRVTVPRLGPEHKEALSSYARNKAFWEKRSGGRAA